MRDTRKTQAAVNDAADESVAETIDQTAEPALAAADDGAATSSAEPAQLRLARQTDEAADDGLLGTPATADDSADDDQAGRPDGAAPRQGRSALFGGGRKAADDEEASKWAMSSAMQARPPGSSIRVVNRVVAAAVGLILVFGVLDLFATMRQAPGDMPLIPGATRAASLDTGPAATPSGPVPPLANLLASFSNRPIFRDLDQPPTETTVQVVRTRNKEPDWKVRAQKLDLIGLSDTVSGETEAIVADDETGRMHILKIGQEIVVGECRFTLVRIAIDHVAFEKDGDEVTVK